MRRILAIFSVVLGVFLGARILYPSSADSLRQTMLWVPLTHSCPLTVRIAPACCQFDAPGNDNTNLNEEYVCFQNIGDKTISMTGWQVHDAIDTTYIFSAFELPPQGFVKLHTGAGADSSTDLYWGKTRAVWNNTGDTVYLYDNSGELIDQYAY